jgi:hypothetical protein
MVLTMRIRVGFVNSIRLLFTRAPRERFWALNPAWIFRTRLRRFGERCTPGRDRNEIRSPARYN